MIFPKNKEGKSARVEDFLKPFVQYGFGCPTSSPFLNQELLTL